MSAREMINTLAYVTTAVTLTIFAATPALAGPAAKFSATVSNVTLVNKTAAKDWTTVMTTYIKTPNKKDLLIGCSFETGLYTQTEVKSKHGKSDTSNSEAGLYVKLVIDGKDEYAYPHYVVYDWRSQTLSAKLGGVIESCTDTNGDGTITVADECMVSTEEINLILDTMSAHHYNFVVPNLTPGTHKIEVKAKVATYAHAEEGSADAMAMVGRGSLTVEEVRATNSPDGIEFIE